MKLRNASGLAKRTILTVNEVAIGKESNEVEVLKIEFEELESLNFFEGYVAKVLMILKALISHYWLPGDNPLNQRRHHQSSLKV